MSGFPKLSDRQFEVFQFVVAWIKQNGFAPSRSEIARHFQFNPNAAQCHLRSLQRRGFIRIVPRLQRNILVTAP